MLHTKQHKGPHNQPTAFCFMLIHTQLQLPVMQAQIKIHKHLI